MDPFRQAVRPAAVFSVAGDVLSLGLVQRITLFVLLFGAEWIPILALFPPGTGGRFVFRLGVVCASLFLTLGCASFRSISRELEKTPIGSGFLIGHACAVLAFILLSSVLLGDTPGTAPAYVIVPSRYIAAILAVGLAGFALVPPRLAWRVIRADGSAWAYALPAGLIAWALTQLPFGDSIWNGPFWRPATDLTFYMVSALLHLFLPQVVADRATMTIGAPDFAVTIGDGCSGWEGTALMLVFSVAWLCVGWREFRMPRALLMVPVAMVVMWTSNAVRIAALILIGVAGAPHIAMNGFHSEAGWITFNCVALGFAVASRRVPWFALRTPEPPSRRTFAGSSTVAYLLPFLALLAAAMISRAASGGFEWLYPLRLIAVAAVLWFLRPNYAGLDWRFGSLSLILGGVVFAIWLALGRFLVTHTDNGIASGLSLWPASARIAWLVCRTAAAVTTVPVAEELAFRGFLIRRLISGDFESISPRKYTYFSVLLSSIAFGLLHGSYWLPGTMAGVFYAVAFLRRGRIGDAVVAHATTNALLAAWVLWSGNWSLW